MKRLFLIFICFNFGIHICAQETLTISREEAEAMFLQNNLLLVAEKLNIESQRAEVIQARLWPNPEFSVSEVNRSEERRVGKECRSRRATRYSSTSCMCVS